MQESGSRETYGRSPPLMIRHSGKRMMFFSSMQSSPYFKKLICILKHNIPEITIIRRRTIIASTLVPYFSTLPAWQIFLMGISFILQELPLEELCTIPSLGHRTRYRRTEECRVGKVEVSKSR